MCFGPPRDEAQVRHAFSLSYNSGSYLGIDRSDDVVFIQITLNHGRSTEQKKALYAKIAERLGANPGVRAEDLVISLNEIHAQDWSLGNGEAQYA